MDSCLQKVYWEHSREHVSKEPKENVTPHEIVPEASANPIGSLEPRVRKVLLSMSHS